MSSSTPEDPVLREAVDVRRTGRADDRAHALPVWSSPAPTSCFSNGSARNAVNTPVGITTQRRAIRSLKRQNARPITRIVRSTASYGTEPINARLRRTSRAISAICPASFRRKVRFDQPVGKTSRLVRGRALPDLHHLRPSWPMRVARRPAQSGTCPVDHWAPALTCPLPYVGSDGQRHRRTQGRHMPSPRLSSIPNRPTPLSVSAVTHKLEVDADRRDPQRSVDGPRRSRCNGLTMIGGSRHHGGAAANNPQGRSTHEPLFRPASAVARAIGSLCLTKATLAISASSAAIPSTGTITLLDRRRLVKTKAALSAQAFSSGLFTVKSDIAACSRSRWTLQATSGPFRVRSGKDRERRWRNRHRPYRILQNSTPDRLR